jgi:hypothetical protein
LQTEEPYWLDDSDTGYMQRNLKILLALFFDKNGLCRCIFIGMINILFEYQNRDKYEAVTTFVNPIDEIESLLKNIIFSTELLPNPIPKPEDWWYYGQHISFYSEKTFEFIAKKYNLNYANLGGLHLLSEKI